MIDTRTRIAIIIVLLIIGGYALFQQSYELSALCGLLAALVVRSYYKDGTVVLAARAFKNNDYDKAERLLKQVINPDYLRKKRRGYYEFILGNIALKKQDMEAAETHFQISSRFPLSSENDKGIILMHLANINLRKKDFKRVRAYVERAKELNVSSRIQEIIKKIEKEIPQNSDY